MPVVVRLVLRSLFKNMLSVFLDSVSTVGVKKGKYLYYYTYEKNNLFIELLLVEKSRLASKNRRLDIQGVENLRKQ